MDIIYQIYRNPENVIIFEDKVEYYVDIRLASLIACARQRCFANYTFVLNKYESKIGERILENRKEVDEITCGLLHCLEYHIEIAHFAIFCKLYHISRLNPIMKTDTNMWMLPNIGPYIYKYNKNMLYYYFDKIATYNFPGYIELCQRYKYNCYAQPVIMRSCGTDNFLAQSIQHYTKINFTSIWRSEYDELYITARKLKDITQTLEMLRQNADHPLGYGLAYVLGMRNINVRIDNQKALVLYYYITSHKINTDLSEFRESVEQGCEIIDFKRSLLPRPYCIMKHNHKIVKIMLQNDLYAKNLISEGSSYYLHFEWDDAELISAYTNSLMKHSTDYVHTLVYAAKRSYISHLKYYDGPIFLMNIYPHTELGTNSFRYDLQKFGVEQDYFRMVAEGKLIITCKYLLFDDEEYVAAIMMRPETFLRFKNTIIKYESYDAASSRFRKSAHKI